MEFQKGELAKVQLTDQAKCRGLNAKIFASSGRITVSYIFPHESIEISISNILAIELVVNSIFPPIILSVVSAIFLVGVWWFVGAWSWPVILPSSYLLASTGASFSCVIGLVATGYALSFGKINIATIHGNRRVTVRMIPKRSGEAFVNSMRRSIRETER
jgi:hypothetical protein